MPVANPEGVAPLLAISFAARSSADSPVRVLALVNRTGSEVSPGAPPNPAALIAALEYAKTRGIEIEAQSVWSVNAGADIIAAARNAKVGWILIGYHREASGGDTMGGVVRDVLASAKGANVHVGVFIQGTDQQVERIFAAVDASADGRAALDLAVRIAKSHGAKLRALLVSNTLAQSEDHLLDIIRDARSSMGRRFHSDVLSERSLDQLLQQSPGRLLIVGKKLADEIRLPLNEAPEGDRCVIVVQGGDSTSSKPAARDHSRHA